MIMSNIRCSDYERRALVAMLQGKKNTESAEDFSSVLDSEIKKLEPDTRPKLNDSNKMQ